MNAKFLVIATAFILFGLFWFSKVYRQKEKKLSALEVKYFEAILAFKKDNGLKDNAMEIGREYAMALGLSEEEAHAMLEKDMSL